MSKKHFKWLGLIIGIIILVILPQFLSPYLLTFLFNTLMFVTFAQSWNILSGYGGYVSLGHVAFFGIGAYTAALLITRLGTPPFISLLFGGIAASLLALALGSVVLRVRGAYFAIVTFGLSEVLKTIAVNLQRAEGTLGIVVPPIPSRLYSYYIALFIAVVTTIVVYFVDRSKFGYGLTTIREDEEVAEGLGINTYYYKIFAYTLGAFFPGVFGALFAWHSAYIDPHSVFTPFYSFYSMIFTIFGGIGTVFGPLLGSVVLSIIQEILWARLPYWHVVIYGIIIILMVTYLPGGLMQLVKERIIYHKVKGKV